MGIIQTDQWLKEDLDRPMKICKKLSHILRGKKQNEYLPTINKLWNVSTIKVILK